MLMKMGLSFQEGGAYKILIPGNYIIIKITIKHISFCKSWSQSYFRRDF